MTVSRPGANDPRLDSLIRQLRAGWEFQPRVEIIGLSGISTAAGPPGGDVSIRYRASLATNYVQVHVQSTAVGEGGASYDASNFTSSVRVDCLENRQQDVVISRNGTDIYYLWLIPVFKDGDGTFVKYDGVDSPDDFMAFWDLGR